MHTHLALRRRSVPSDTRHIEAPGSLAVYLPSARSALISWLILSLLAVIDSRLSQFHHHSVRARPVAYSMGANAVIRHYFDLLRCPNPDNVFASGFARRPSRRITLSRRVEKTRSPPSRDRQSTSRQAAFHTRSLSGGRGCYDCDESEHKSSLSEFKQSLARSCKACMHTSS